MPTFRLKIAAAARALAFAWFVGGAFALSEFAVYHFFKPATWADWSFYLGPSELAYGVRGWWQLAAHKAFAFGWLVPAATALVAILTAPLSRLYRVLPLRPGRLGVAVAAAAVLTVEAMVGLASFRPGAAAPHLALVILSAPAATALIAGAFYLAFSARPLARFAAARWLPSAAVAGWLGAAVVSFLPFPDARPVPGGPNLIYITVDALRADRVGPHGGVTLTPNFDRCAARGVAFRRCMVAAPWTLPSLASVHTGLYPPAHGAGLGGPLGPQFTTLAELLADAGYDTAGIVGNGFCEPRFGLAQGFRYYRSMEMFPGALPSRLYYTKLPLPFFDRKRLYINTTPVLEKRALSYIDGRRGRKRPFFLWIHFLDCHSPYTPPPRFVSPDAYARRFDLDLENPGPADKALAEELYDGEVCYVDETVGLILGRLKKAGLETSTVVALSADHGEEFWDHGGWEHGQSLYDELVTVPLVITGPGWAAGAAAATEVSSVDLYATFAKTCGVALSTPNQSRDIMRMEAGGGRAFWAFSTAPKMGDPELTATSDGVTKIIFSPLQNRWELYNLAVDPGERDTEGENFVAGALIDSIKSWRRECAGFTSYYGAGAEKDAMVEAQMRAMGYIK